MAAGTAYTKRYPAGFVDKPTLTTPIDQAFLNAVEAALLQLIGAAPTADAQVMQWDNANTRYGPALILNKNIDPAAAISKTKLDFSGANGIVNADVAGAAAIARSKLDFGAGLVNADISAAAAIALSKINLGGNVGQVVKGDGSVSGPALYRKTTAKAVNTTTAATDLLNGEITIAAGVMGATGTIRLTAFGDFKNNSGGTTNNARFQLLFGGTTLFDTGAGGFAWTDTATRLGWRLVVEITNTASGAQVAHFLYTQATLSGIAAAAMQFTTGEGTVLQHQGGSATTNFIAQAYNTSAVDTTVAKALVLNVINPSASANYETKLTSALVELL